MATSNIKSKRVWVVEGKEFSTKAEAREYLEGGEYAEVVRVVTEHYGSEASTPAAQQAARTRARRIITQFCEDLKKHGLVIVVDTVEPLVDVPQKAA